MHKTIPVILGAAMMAVALTAGAQAAGNLASQPTYLETKINGPDKSWTGNDFQLEVGKYYIWEITSDGIEETLVQAPELFRNAWFNQVVINDKEVHSSGAYYGVEYDGAGTIAISTTGRASAVDSNTRLRRPTTSSSVSTGWSWPPWPASS